MSDTAVDATTSTTDIPSLQPHPETAVPVTSSGATTDSDAPRLGGGPLTAPAPMGVPEAPEMAAVAAPVADLAPALPENAPMLPTSTPQVAPTPPAPTPKNAEERFAQNAMKLDAAFLPKLPETSAAVPTTVEPAEDSTADDQDAASDGAQDHPMAHLMPTKSKPTQASIRAAEQRAIKKAKARKVKIGVFVAALAISALAGPPLVSWLTNAINESGGTTSETVD